MRKTSKTALIQRCLMAAWAVMLPLLAAPDAPDEIAAARVAEAADGCACDGCPSAERHPVCPRETAPPCRTQNSCARCVDSTGTALFLAPTPTQISPPTLSGPICCVEARATDLAYAPPTPPPRSAALS